MTTPTGHAVHADQPADATIDLTTARRIARGSAQQTWLAELPTPGGLRVANHLPRHWTTSTYRRITALLTRLWVAGYDIYNVPGPRGGRGSWHLTGYRPDQAPQRTVIAALGYDLQFTARPGRWDLTPLLAMLETETLQTLQNATDLLTCTNRRAWNPTPFDVPMPQALADILNACRTTPATRDPATRGRHLAQLINAAARTGQRMTLAYAAQTADYLAPPSVDGPLSFTDRRTGPGPDPGIGRS